MTPSIPKRNLFISGRPGVGKTTLVRRLVESLPVRAAGFYTSEIREAGRRVGFALDLLNGETAILAHVDFRGPARVGKYGVDVATFERVAIPELERALQEADLIVIDEIGKMELLSSRFLPTVIRALESPKPVLATVMADGPPAVQQLKTRPDVEHFEITRENRERLAVELMNRLREGTIE